MKAALAALSALILFELAAPAVCKPVYLQCTNAALDRDGSKIVFNVTFDEDANTMTLSGVGTTTTKFSPVFTAAEVRGMHSDGPVSRDFRIDRTTGTYTDLTTAGDLPPIRMQGSCAAVEAKPRKF